MVAVRAAESRTNEAMQHAAQAHGAAAAAEAKAEAAIAHALATEGRAQAVVQAQADSAAQAAAAAEQARRSEQEVREKAERIFAEKELEADAYRTENQCIQAVASELRAGKKRRSVLIVRLPMLKNGVSTRGFKPKGSPSCRNNLQTLKP